MKIKVSILLSALMLISVYSFGQKVTREIGRFDEIQVSHGIQVLLTTTQGEYGEVYLRSEGVDLDDIVTEVNRGVLRIKFNDFDFFDNDKYDRREVYITVPVQELEALTINTGALVETREELRVESLEVDMTTGGEAELEVVAERLKVELSMGSVAEVMGSTARAELKATMGSEIMAKHLECEFAYIKASMGSEIDVTVLGEVEASARMGAEIDIYGTPERVYTSDSFGGEISVLDF